MAFNGSGLFLRIFNWAADAAANIKITASRMDTEMDGFATGLSNCVTKDGQTTPTANIPMGTFRHTGVGDSSSLTSYPSTKQLQNGSVTYSTDTGAVNAYLAGLSPAPTLYTAGLDVYILVANSNTGASTINVSALGVKDIRYSSGAALSGGALIAGQIAHLKYNGTYFNLLSTESNTAGPKTFTGPVTMSGSAIFLAEGADVATASSTNIWVGDGNTKHLTGSATINDFGTAPQAGAIMRCISNSTPTLANGVNLITNNDGSNIVCRAEDSWWVFAETTTIMKVFGYQRSDGTALRATNTDRLEYFTNATWPKPAGFPSTAIAIIECWAGAGSGAKVAATNHAGGGGGGGYARREMPLSALGATEVVTIGLGGPAQGTDGGTIAGGNTTFGAHLTAFGGAGGLAGNSSEGAGGGGGGEIAAGVTDVGGAIGGSSPNQNGPANAKTIWGGGAGSGVWNNAGTPTATNAGNAVYGGGGGAGQHGNGTGLSAGTSKFGGPGGAAKAAGSVPGGGGGGSSGVGASGAGGAGKCVVTVVS